MTTGGAPVPVIYGGTGSATASDARTALGLAIGTNVQAFNANLAAEAGLVTAASKMTQWTGSGTAQLVDLLFNTSWTPVIQGSSTPGSGTYSAQVGRYTKIGDMVFCTAYLVWSAHTGTGLMQLAGLPYTARNNANAFWTSGGNFFSSITMNALSTYLCCYVNPNTTNMSFVDMTPGAVSAATSLDTAGTVVITFAYPTAS
jgi:hypothetical protein